MSLSLELAQKLECPVCKRWITDDGQNDGRVKDALFGHVNFGICPNCGQEVDEETVRDAKYQARALRCAVRKKREHKQHEREQSVRVTRGDYVSRWHEEFGGEKAQSTLAYARVLRVNRSTVTLRGEHGDEGRVRFEYFRANYAPVSEGHWHPQIEL